MNSKSMNEFDNIHNSSSSRLTLDPQYNPNLSLYPNLQINIGNSQKRNDYKVFPIRQSIYPVGNINTLTDLSADKLSIGSPNLFDEKPSLKSTVISFGIIIAIVLIACGFIAAIVVLTAIKNPSNSTTAPNTPNTTRTELTSTRSFDGFTNVTIGSSSISPSIVSAIFLTNSSSYSNDDTTSSSTTLKSTTFLTSSSVATTSSSVATTSSSVDTTSSSVDTTSTSVATTSSSVATTSSSVATTSTSVATTSSSVATTAVNSECLFVPNANLSGSACSYGYNGAFCDECGLKFSAPNVKIVGGSASVAHSWPSMAFIVFKYKFNYTIRGRTYESTRTSYCGGSLINRNTVLTAAHCYLKTVSYVYLGIEYSYTVVTNVFHPTIESMYTVYLGLDNNKGVFDGTSFSPGVAMRITRFTIHSNYDDYTNLNDIALIKLKSDAILNCYIQPACLPNPSIANYPIATNISVWAAGWGTLKAGGSSPDVLYDVKMTLYSSSFCSFVSQFVRKDWSTQICAGEYAGGKDTCQGDSGGPLFVKETLNGKQKFVVVGITSYGDGCADAQLPGIYTKVSAFLTWIGNNS